MLFEFIAFIMIIVNHSYSSLLLSYFYKFYFLLLTVHNVQNDDFIFIFIV